MAARARRLKRNTGTTVLPVLEVVRFLVYRFRVHESLAKIVKKTLTLVYPSRGIPTRNWIHDCDFRPIMKSAYESLVRVWAAKLELQNWDYVFSPWKHGTVLIVMQAVRAPDPSYRILLNLAGNVHARCMMFSWVFSVCTAVIRNLKNPQTALWVPRIQQIELQLSCTGIHVREFLTISSIVWTSTF